MFEETHTTSNKHTQIKTKVPTQHDNFDLINADALQERLFWQEASCCCALDHVGGVLGGQHPLLFCNQYLIGQRRVRLVPLTKIQIKYVDTKHQLADILTKGNFTRDEWNSLLHLFNIIHFSSLCCTQNFSLTSCSRTMAKVMQEQEGDNRIVARSKPTTMNLAVSVSTSSKSPGILKASCRTDWSSSGKPDARNSNHEAASSSQGWQKDALLDGCTGKPVATEEHQEHLNYPEEFVGTGKPVAPKYQGYPGTPGTPGDSGDSEAEGNDKYWPHHFRISPNYVQHMEKVFSIVRQRCGRSPTDQMHDLDVNTAVFLCLSLFKLQFILGMSIRKIFDLPRINPWNLWNSYSIWLRGWSPIRQKLPDWPRLTGSSLCGKRLLC